MLEALRDGRLQQILSRTGDDTGWRRDLERVLSGDASLTRLSAGEAGIRAVQRLLVFLGYSTASSGAFLIDGDFGRGTNRGLAQFQVEHGLPTDVSRPHLCYECTRTTAPKRIVAIPETHLDLATLDAMVTLARDATDRGDIPLGRFEDALFHLNALDDGRLLRCAQIRARYGAAVDSACRVVTTERSVEIQPEWVLAIIRQETAGIVRPRFEQHKLSTMNQEHPRTDLVELRHRSMSIGLGQIMGFNHRAVGAPSARAMIAAPVDEQILYIARFLVPEAEVCAKLDPVDSDFRRVARFYNGPQYHAHFYHERLARWFGEFRRLRPSRGRYPSGVRG